MKAHMNHCVNRPLLLRQPPPLAIPFSHRGRRETRVTRETGEEAQWAMGRRKMRGETPSWPFSPSRLPLRANFYGYEVASKILACQSMVS